MAHEIAAELDVSPWEALLSSVRRAAGRVAYVDAKLAAVEAELRPGGSNDGGGTGELRAWLAESRKERLILARVAKAAIDAGVAERLVRQVEMESAIIVRVLARTLDALELDPDSRVRAHEVVHQQLLAITGSDDLVEP